MSWPARPTRSSAAVSSLSRRAGHSEIPPARGCATRRRRYAAATLRVDELLAGSLAPPDAATLTLEIPLFDGPASIADLPDWGDGVFFVRSKATSAREAGMSLERQAEEAAFHRLVTFGGLVVDDAGVAATDPGAPLLADLAGLPFAEAVERVREAAGR